MSGYSGVTVRPVTPELLYWFDQAESMLQNDKSFEMLPRESHLGTVTIKQYFTDRAETRIGNRTVEHYRDIAEHELSLAYIEEFGNGNSND